MQGKRLRPCSCTSGSSLRFGDPRHHTLAAVVEMIHAATLVHDDILDEADRRRHVITVNSEWGNEASVLLGDYLFTHSFHLAASLDSTFACRWIGRARQPGLRRELHQISAWLLRSRRGRIFLDHYRQDRGIDRLLLWIERPLRRRVE
ncbi:MAG: polyprenyl synthetase family protein [Planctomycetota bacterium]